jgi:acyl-CoA synthetase
VPDPRLGERVCLAVVASSGTAPDPAGILEHLEAGGVSRSDLPEFIVFLTEMPLTVSGKIVKRELVRWVVEGRVQPCAVHLRRLAPAAAG